MSSPASGAARRLTSLIAQTRCADEIVALVEKQLQNFDHIHTTACLHAFAKHAGAGRTGRIAPRHGETPSNSAEALQNLLQRQVWAAARLAEQATLAAPAGFLRRVTADLVSHGPCFNHQDVANTLWAFAILHLRFPGGQEALPRVASAEVLRRPAGFKPQELANTIWALAECGTGRALEIALPLMEFATRTPGTAAAQFEAQHLSSVAWAVAATELATPLESLADEARRRLGDFRPQELANFSWALACCGRLSAPLAWLPTMQGLAVAANSRSSEFNCQELVNTAWAFAESWPSRP